MKMNNENPDDEFGNSGEGVGTISFQDGDGVGSNDISSVELYSSLRHPLAVEVAVIRGIMRFGAVNEVEYDCVLMVVVDAVRIAGSYPTVSNLEFQITFDTRQVKGRLL